MSEADPSALTAVTRDEPSDTDDAPTRRVETRLDFYPGLEGVRGVALMLEIVGHTLLYVVVSSASWLFSGVAVAMSVFFGLSGFFITALLLIEYEKRGTIKVKQFWWKRARRVYPPLVLMLVLHGLLVLYYHRPLWLEWRQDVWAMLLAINYKYSLPGQDPILGYDVKVLWSLAIEGQFYLLWPFLILGLQRYARTLERVIVIMIALALGSTFVRALEFHMWRDWHVVYYRSEGRIDAFCLGGVVAYLWFYKKLPKEIIRKIAWIAWLFFMLVLVIVRLNYGWLYSWGFMATNIFAAIMIAACMDDRLRITRVMSWRLPCLLGRVSYTFYIVHIQVFFWVLLQRRYLSTWQRVALAWGGTLVVGSIAYFIAERPMLKRPPLAKPKWLDRLPGRRSAKA